MIVSDSIFHALLSDHVSLYPLADPLLLNSYDGHADSERGKMLATSVASKRVVIGYGVTRWLWFVTVDKTNDHTKDIATINRVSRQLRDALAFGHPLACPRPVVQGVVCGRS